MSHISATDANRNFSRLLREVENGARVTITKDGRPVAVLSPVGQQEPGNREAALQRMKALMEEGMEIGYQGPLDRDELHRR